MTCSFVHRRRSSILLKKIPEAVENPLGPFGGGFDGQTGDSGDLVFFMPYKIERRFRSFPLVTVILIALNTAVYFATAGNLVEIVDSFGFRANPAGSYTWFTSLFLHAGIVHLLGNMYFLWLFGSMAEDGLGKLRYTILYVVGGVAACVLHALITVVATPAYSQIPLVGASGAIAAVIGVVAIRMHRAKIKVAYFYWFLYPKWGVWRISAALAVGLYALQEVANGLMSTMLPDGTAHWAHVGGLIAGLALGLSWGTLKEASREYLAEEARGYAAAGLGEVASQKYGELADQDPDNPEWLLEKVRACALSLSPDPAQLTEDFARCVVMLKKAERTQDIVDLYGLVAQGRAAEQSLDPRSLQAVASAAESLRDYDVAERAYGTLLVVHPRSGEAERALFRLAHIYLARGRVDEARQTWRAFAESYPQSAWMAYADRAFAAG